MAWFYNNKQIYGAWTDSEGTSHPATWDADWTDEEKRQAGLVEKGEINTRFFDSNGDPLDVDTIKAQESARMDGLYAHIIGQTCSDVISEVDGSPLEDSDINAAVLTQRSNALSSKDSAKTLIAAETTFDGLYDLIMNSNKIVHGVYVPASSGDWGVTPDSENLHPRPPVGIE